MNASETLSIVGIQIHVALHWMFTAQLL